MTGKGLAVAAAFCVLAAPGAFAQKSVPDSGSAAAGPRLRSAAPVAAHAAKSAVSPGPAVLPNWSPLELEQAHARCAVLLKGLDAVVVQETPMREGPECGTPAPMKLISIGRSPQIALSPPPTLTCDMVATLARWLERDVQPLARKHLGAPIVRVETMSSYSCRNAYGRAHGRLSEHGKANAIDIGSFATTRGQAALVVADWGPTARQIAAQAAAAAKRADEQAPGQASAQPVMVPVQGGMAQQGRSVPIQRPSSATAILPLDLRPGMTIGIPGITLDLPGSPGRSPSAFGLSSPSRLGGPKPPASAEPTVSPDGKTDFLRAAHRSACKLFNTVLGPEANNAHLNHFHLDMAERIKNTKVCE